MQPLLRKDVLKLFLIFFVVFAASFFGFQESLKRERDQRRSEDIGNIARALEAYKIAFGYYPESSEDGRIVACAGNNTRVLRDKTGVGIRELGALRDKIVNMVPCDWGQDSLGDPLDDNYPPFLEKIPQDPLANKGLSYKYSFNDGRYFIYTAYETKKMPDYSKSILDQRIKCGVHFCNSARTNGVVTVK